MKSDMGGITESVFGHRRSRILAVAAVMIAAIAVIDWKITTEMSFGFLYFFPIFMVAACLRQWQIAVVAALCAVLRETFGPYGHTVLVYPRLFLTWGSFTAAGWLVRGVLENWKRVRAQLVEIQKRDELLEDSEKQLRVLIDTSSAAILTLDKSGTVIQANEAAGKILGEAQGALLGRSIADFLPALAQVPSDKSAPAFRTTMECPGRRSGGDTFLANVCFSTYIFSSEPRLTAVITESEPPVSDLPEGSEQAAMSSVALTNLEQAVLRGIFEGQGNKEIAANLETSESAVKSTIQRLFSKLGARTRSQLVRIAIEQMGGEFHTAPHRVPGSDQKILSK